MDIIQIVLQDPQEKISKNTYKKVFQNYLFTEKLLH